MALWLGPSIGTLWIDHSEEADSSDGFDQLTRHTEGRHTSLSACRTQVSLGDVHPSYPYMICTGRRASKVKCDIFAGEFTYRGVMDDEKPLKITVRNWAEKQSAKNAFYPSSPSYGVSLESNQPLLGVTFNYVATEEPSSHVAGTNITPIFAPTPPDNIWTTIADPIHTYPFGWTLDSREFERIPGSAVCLVTDQYVFYQHYKPGGG